MKKVIALLLIIFLLVCSFSFVGCGEEEKKEISLLVTLKTKKEKTDTAWTEKSYTVKSSNKQNLSTYYITTDYVEDIEIETLLVDENGYAPTLLSETNPDFTSVLMGQYKLTRKYQGFGEFIIKINVMDTRPELDVVFSGGMGCDEFGEVEDYTYGHYYLDEKTYYFKYTYDGGWHNPSAVLRYGEQTILALSEEDIKPYLTWTNSQEDIEPTVDRGVYLFDFKIDRNDLPENYRNKFRDFEAKILIQIAQVTYE